MGSFSWDSDTPIYIFSKSLSFGNPKYTWEAVRRRCRG
jgi:hypothetical protein